MPKNSAAKAANTTGLRQLLCTVCALAQHAVVAVWLLPPSKEHALPDIKRFR